jgi:predicted regulator of Ras-like GTPase activity (Roadblock/LC7/MglB family)
MNPDPGPAPASDQRDRLRSVLEDFLQRAGAGAALVVDGRGRPVAAAGSTDAVDETSFAALAAAAFEAARQLARLLGGDNVDVAGHHGARHSLRLVAISDSLLLAATFPAADDRGPMALELRRAAQQLRAVMGPAADPAAPAGPGPGFSRAAVSEIDRLLGG